MPKFVREILRIKESIAARNRHIAICNMVPDSKSFAKADMKSIRRFKSAKERGKLKGRF